jgi:hypothetical protein
VRCIKRRRRQVAEEKRALEEHLTGLFGEHGGGLVPLLRATAQASTLSSSAVGALPPQAHAPSQGLYAAYRAAVVGAAGGGQPAVSDSALVRPLTDRMAAAVFSDAVRAWHRLRRSRRAGRPSPDGQLLGQAVADAAEAAGALEMAPFFAW